MGRLSKIATNLKIQLLLATLFAFATTGLFLLSNVSEKGSFVLMVALWALVLAAVTVYESSVRKEETPYGPICLRLIARCVLISLGMALLFELGTIVGSPQALLDWEGMSGIVKIGLFRFAIYACTVYSIALLFLCKSPASLKGLARRAWAQARSRIRLRSLLLIGIPAVAAAGFALGARYLGGLSLKVSFAFALAFLVSIMYIVLSIANGKATPAGLFLAIALPWSAFLALCSAPITGLSFDDQIHYGNVQVLSYIINAPRTTVEATFYNPQLTDPAVNNPRVYFEMWESLPQSALWDYEWRMNVLYPESELSAIDPGVGSCLGVFHYIGYVPSAIGLWLGRLAHLPIVTTFVIGRLFNALAYVFFTYAAIRIIPCKKMLLCIIALLPTTLFLSANYSYDPWVISFLYLMVALLVKAMVSENGSIGFKDWIWMVAVGFMAMGPKAVYFPLFALLYLIPKARFESREQSILFRYCVSLLIIVTASSFAVPFLISSGEGYTDYRGMEGTDASGQLGFMLSQPLDYLAILFDFLFQRFFTIANFNGLSYEFAYMDSPIGDTIMEALPCLNGYTLLLVVITSCIDADALSNRISKISYGVISALACVASSMLIVTALYVTFVAVGSHEIEGVQPRYLTPMLFSLFLFGLNPKVRNTKVPWRRNIALTVLMAIPLVLICGSVVWLFNVV